MGAPRLLIVDDEPQLAGLLRRYLERAGFEVDVCGDAKTALDLYIADPLRYAVVVTDLTMRDINGEEMLDRMRQHNPALRAVIASGYPHEPRQAGVVFLQKPFLPQMLIDVVNKILPGAD